MAHALGGFVDGVGTSPAGVIEYPVSDGQPMAESDAHADEMRDYAIGVLRDHFRDAGDVYVSGNNFIYYREGDPRAVVSPDTYVVFGVAPGQRDTFKLWEEGGHRPRFVLELTSKSTRKEDTGGKLLKYQDQLKVPEYFLFDLWADWIPEGLIGYRLDPDGSYRPIAPNARGRLLSQQLKLELGILDGHLRFFRPGRVAPLPTLDERLTRAEQERKQAEQEREQAELALQGERESLHEAQAELARLRALLDGSDS